MPMGKGTYGKTRGRPPKKKGVKKIQMNKLGKKKKQGVTGLKCLVK